MEGLFFAIIQNQGCTTDGRDVVFVQTERKPSSLEGQSDVYKNGLCKERTAYYSSNGRKHQQPQVSFQRSAVETNIPSTRRHERLRE